MKKVNSILFVCLGNICRSPIAQGVALKYSKEMQIDLNVFSSGTGDWHIGEAPCENSIKVSKNNDVDISSYKASQTSREELQSYDIVVGLDSKNIDSIKALGRKDVVLLGDFGYDGANVPDPYFFDGFEGFDKVFEMIDTCVKNLINEKCLA